MATTPRVRSRKSWVLAIPLTVLAIGIGLLCYFGWDYAQQTIFVNDQQEPTYDAAAYGPRLWPVKPAVGTKIGELDIPSLHLEAPVIQGTGWNQLKHGIGHYASSALPGQGGNVFVAGHRDTVFTKLRYLKKGADIIFETPYGNFVYQATSFQIVKQTDTSVLAPTNHETLTLMTCYPFFFFGFAPDRYIVHTKLVSEPNAAAREVLSQASQHS
jgi:sortase A